MSVSGESFLRSTVAELRRIHIPSLREALSPRVAGIGRAIAGLALAGGVYLGVTFFVFTVLINERDLAGYAVSEFEEAGVIIGGDFGQVRQGSLVLLVILLYNVAQVIAQIVRRYLKPPTETRRQSESELPIKRRRSTLFWQQMGLIPCLVVMVLAPIAGNHLPFWTVWLDLFAIVIAYGLFVSVWIGWCDRFGLHGSAASVVFAFLYTVVSQPLSVWRDPRVWVCLAACVALALVSVWMVTWQRRVPVEYAKRLVNGRMIDGTKTHIPLDVFPFAGQEFSGIGALIAIHVIAVFFPGSGFAAFVNAWLWPNPELRSIWPALILATVLTVGFCVLLRHLDFFVPAFADNLRAMGGFIPGVRAGELTEEYFAAVYRRLLPTFILRLVVLMVILLPLWHWTGYAMVLPAAPFFLVVGLYRWIAEHKAATRDYQGFLS